MANVLMTTRETLEMWKGSLVPAVVGVAIITSSAAGQNTRNVFPGDTVRFERACQPADMCSTRLRVHAAVTEVWTDSMALLAPGPMVYRFDELLGLERLAGRKNRAPVGAAIGAGIGFGAGVVIGNSEEPGQCGIGEVFCIETRRQRAFLGGILGGVVGATVGGLIGVVIRTDDWETVRVYRQLPEDATPAQAPAAVRGVGPEDSDLL